MNKTNKHTFLTFASLSCSIHCLLTPVLILIFPFLGSLSHNHELEITLLILSVLCGTYIITNGYCKHKKAHSVFLFLTGALFWSLKFLAEPIFHDAEIILITIGSLFVIFSYIINHNFLKCCPSKCDNHD